MTTPTERIDDFHLLSAAHPDHPMGAVGSFLYSLESNEPLGAKAAMIGAHAFEELLVDLPLMARMFPGAVEGYIVRLKTALETSGDDAAAVKACEARLAAIRNELDQSQENLKQLEAEQANATRMTTALGLQLDATNSQARAFQEDAQRLTAEIVDLKRQLGQVQTPQEADDAVKTLQASAKLVASTEASRDIVDTLANSQRDQSSLTEDVEHNSQQAEDAAAPKFMSDWVTAMKQMAPDLDQAALFNPDEFITNPNDRALGTRPDVPLSIDALDAIVQMSEGRDDAETGWRVRAVAGTGADAGSARGKTYGQLTKAWKALRNLSEKHSVVRTPDLVFSKAIGDLTRTLMFTDYVTAYSALTGRAMVGKLEPLIQGTGRDKKNLFSLISETPGAFKAMDNFANTRTWYTLTVVHEYVTANLAMTAAELKEGV